MPFSTQICDLIRTIRRKKGYSQEYMASMLSITSEAYGKIERNQTKLDVEKLEKIALILETDVNELLLSGNNKHNSSEGISTLNGQLNDEVKFLKSENEFLRTEVISLLSRLPLTKKSKPKGK